jgi:cation diffusion facilitator family transporter
MDKTRVTVYVALASNVTIALAKAAAGALSGSAAMLAEAAHSFADCTNQILLLVSLSLGERKPDEEHPFGYGKERFFWSFIAAIFIFGVGATYALHEGYTKLRHPHAPEHLAWAYWVLGISFVLEAASIVIAIRQEVQEAHHEGLTFREYLRESKDPTAKTVIFEDSAALIGIIVAAVGIYLTDHQVWPGSGAYWDGLASMVIGGVLAIVAFVLARTSRGLLLGEAATPKSVAAIRKAIKSHRNVCEVVELLTMHLAPKQILVNAHINLRDELTTDEIEQTIGEIEASIKSAEPKVYNIFLEAARESATKEGEAIPQHAG